MHRERKKRGRTLLLLGVLLIMILISLFKIELSADSSVEFAEKIRTETPKAFSKKTQEALSQLFEEYGPRYIPLAVFVETVQQAEAEAAAEAAREAARLAKATKQPEKLVDEAELREWLLSNDNNESITLWKMSCEDNLFVQLRDKSGKELATILIEPQGDENRVGKDVYEKWTLCDSEISETSTSDLLDMAFMAYREVAMSHTGRKTIQAQVSVILNRVRAETYYPDSVREVLEQKGQYPHTVPLVKERSYKGKAGENELRCVERCIKETLLVLAGESIQHVPRDVVYAAMFKQGSGVWRYYEETYYCHE